MLGFRIEYFYKDGVKNMDDKLGKILIVDDDENINELIDMYLKSSGYETKKCFNGLDACNIVTNDNIGLVLLDIMLPGKDGVEVIYL